MQILSRLRRFVRCACRLKKNKRHRFLISEEVIGQNSNGEF